MIPTVEKPCIKKCALNEKEVCLGCYRTFEDMVKWQTSSYNEKEYMIIRAHERQKEYTKNTSKV